MSAWLIVLIAVSSLIYLGIALITGKLLKSGNWGLPGSPDPDMAEASLLAYLAMLWPVWLALMIAIGPFFLLGKVIQKL